VEKLAKFDCPQDEFSGPLPSLGLGRGTAYSGTELLLDLSTTTRFRELSVGSGEYLV